MDNLTRAITWFWDNTPLWGKIIFYNIAGSLLLIPFIALLLNGFYNY